MDLNFLLKIKLPLILLLVVLFIVLGWEQFTFNNYEEFIVFIPFIILYLNETRYLELVDEGLSISYWTYEFIIFLFLLISNIMFIHKIYYGY